MEKIKLTSDELRNLVYEEHLNINGEEIPIEIVENEYDDSGRHQEYHHIVFKRLEDNKYFWVNYSNSTQDTMGWDECNYGPFEASEVFPKKVTTIEYVTKL